MKPVGIAKDTHTENTEGSVSIQYSANIKNMQKTVSKMSRRQTGDVPVMNSRVYKAKIE